MEETITYAPALRGLVDLWHRAEDPEDAAAQFALARVLMKSGRPDTVKRAFTLFKKLANGGYTGVQTEARYMLGLCYENGRGIQKSYPRAIRWYKLAGDNVPNDLRPLYKANEDRLNRELDAALDGYEGGYAPPDAAEAAYWTGKAAANGDVEALAELGRMYYYGEGVERDLRRGRDLMELAAKRGSAASAYALGKHYEKMKANRRAAEWYRRYAALKIRERDRLLGRPGGADK